MPYIHWETEQRLAEMKKVIEDVEKNSSTASKKRDKNEELIRVDLVHPRHPLHIRRTLAQYYYTLENIDIRDKSQIVTRYFNDYFPGKKKVVMMVDQLWLWLLDKGSSISPRPSGY